MTRPLIGTTPGHPRSVSGTGHRELAHHALVLMDEQVAVAHQGDVLIGVVLEGHDQPARFLRG